MLVEIQEADLHVPSSLVIDALELLISEGTKSSSHSKRLLKKADSVSSDAAFVNVSPTSLGSAGNMVADDKL